MNSRTQSLAVLCALSLSLAACGGGSSLKDSLGYGKDAPDEFDVITKAPLVMPPDFALRPPQPGAPRPQEEMFQPSLVAQRTLTGETIGDQSMADAAASDNVSAGEEALLQKTGGAEANPAIRKVVNNEMRSLVERDKSFTDDILFWREKTPADEVMVDAQGERQRLQQNAAEGKPVTAGDTPTVEPEKKGFFSGLWSSIF